MKRLAAILAALLLAPSLAFAAALTPPNLTAQSSLSGGDLFVTWPVGSNGPLSKLTWNDLKTNMMSGLGTAAGQNTGTSGATLPFLNGINTWSGLNSYTDEVAFKASTTAKPSFNIAPGVAPTSPINGDCWLTASTYTCQIGGVTQNMLLSGNNLSGLSSAATARTNLGVTATGADTTYAFRSNNLSDLGSASSARSNLGLGSAATQNTGTSGGNIPLLSGNNTWGGTNNFGSNRTGSNVSASDPITNDTTGWQFNGGQLFVATTTGQGINFGRTTAAGNGGVIFFTQGIAGTPTPVGNISVTNTATTYNTSSDYRLKTDLRPIRSGPMLDKIKVYDFAWRNGSGRGYGVLAHELQAVMPQAVTGRKDAVDAAGKPVMQAVDYSKLVPVLVAEVQQLRRRVAVLERRRHN